MTVRFKILSLVGLNLLSFAAHNDAGCIYAIGQVTQAPEYLWQKGYGLCVFKTFDQAIAFLPSRLIHRPVAIYECEVEDQVKELPPMLLPIGYVYGEVQQTRRAAMAWPHGTEMWRTVKLTRVVMQWSGE